MEPTVSTKSSTPQPFTTRLINILSPEQRRTIFLNRGWTAFPGVSAAIILMAINLFKRSKRRTDAL
jgi:hypothetical protein